MNGAYVVFTPPGWLIACDLEPHPSDPELLIMRWPIQLESVAADHAMIAAAVNESVQTFHQLVTKSYQLPDGEIRREAILQAYKSKAASTAAAWRALNKGALDKAK